MLRKKRIKNIVWVLTFLIAVAISIYIYIQTQNIIKNYQSLFSESGNNMYIDMIKYCNHHLITKIGIVTFIFVLINEITLLILDKQNKKELIIYFILIIIIFSFYILPQIFSPLLFLGINGFVYISVCVLFMLINFIRWIKLRSKSA